MPTPENNKPAEPQPRPSILSTLLEVTGDLDTAETVQKTLPPALLKATPAMLATLDQTVADLHAAQGLVEADLARLRPLQRFCIDELNSALKRQWSVVFDVEHDLLSLPGADCDCPPAATSEDGIETVAHATQTLLQAAMQNFSEDEEQADGFPDGSLLRIHSTPAGVSGLTPQAFATFCRKLDLGRRYQTHFQQVFGIAEKDGKAVATRPMTRDIAKMKKLLLQLDMQLAALSNHITAAGVQALQGLIDADGAVSAKSLQYSQRALIMQGIEVLDSCVWGVVVFSARSVELFPDEWCMVYMAGEPERPLYEYPSFNAFKQYLTRQLKVRSYKDYFANSIDEDDKADFFKTFADTADVGHIKQLPITLPLFEFMVQSHVGKLQLDARKLAVPTADIDEEVRRKRLLDFLELGVTIASVAGLVVPVLGQLMMGVALGQLLGEVYEGVEDWRRGDHQQAWSHLLSVAENIALMAVFAGGQKVVGALGRKLVSSNPEFFGQFTPILNRAGKPRLWKPQLARYEHALPAGLTMAEGSTELYQIGDISVGRVDHCILAGSYDPAAKVWRLKHPTRAQAFSPELQQHVEGGWRMAPEQLEQWSSAAYTLKRIDPTLSEFDDADLDMMRRLSGASHEQLQRSFNDNLTLSPRLRDTIARFRLQRQLRELILELERGETHSGQSAEAQLQRLPQLSGWPTDRYIEVTNAEGEVTASYPATSVRDTTLSVIVTQDQLEEGQLLQTVIEGLYPREVDALLGAKVARGAERQALAKKLAAALKADPRSVFDQLYQRHDLSEVNEVVKLRNAMSGLPAHYAKTLIEQAPSVERLHLRSTARVPLKLAQQVLAAASNVRLDRALSGLHWPQIANADTDKLAIQLLPRLSGWDAQLRLELRDKTLKGPILEAIGSEEATTLNSATLVKSASGYAAFAGDGKSLGQVAAGPDSLYAAVLKALPARQRFALGFPDPVDADSARLRRKLLDAALEERDAAARTLREGKFENLTVEAPCIQADQPPTTTHSRALLRKVKKLYPLYSEAQASALLDQLGSDPLTRATRVKGLRQDLENLRNVLQEWSEDVAAMKSPGGTLSEVQHSRKTVAELIENGFRRLLWVTDETSQSVCTLNLNGMRVGKLPTLPVALSFDHIQKLSMKNMAQGDDVAAFLKSFKQVESLELDGNTLTRLPEIISHMPKLARLGLAGNQIKLTEYTLLKLANLRSLHSLNLNGNPLGATPDVSKMFDLRYLALRDTHATELPKGLARLPHLDRVDLRGNQISELPQWLFGTPRQFSETVNLRHNPLSPATRTRMTDYRNNVGVGMGYLEDDIARLDEQKARSLWFTEGVGEELTRRERIWTAFKEDSRAQGLFHLLSELGNTADSVKVSDDMRRRVWKVLDTAYSDAQLCDNVLNLAANPEGCDDAAAINFSHLEVAVEIDRVTNLSGGRITTARPLLELGRGLFRLDQLNQIAQEHARKNPQADPLEVNLAFRTGLADDLSLPGQPRHMRFAELAKVTQTDLLAAKNVIQTAELSSRWPAFMLRQTFWCDYLKRTFAHQFSSINESFPARMDAVFDQAATLSTADYLSQMDAIKVERELAENAVLERLTSDALRLLDLGICATPVV